MIFNTSNTAGKKVELTASCGARMPFCHEYDTETRRAVFVCPTRIGDTGRKFSQMLAKMADCEAKVRLQAGQLSATAEKRVQYVEVYLTGSTLEVEGERY